MGLVQTLDGHVEDVSCIISLPGDLIVSGAYTVKLWDLAAGNCLQTMSGHTTNVECVVAVPGNRVVSGACFGGHPAEMLKCWDLATGNCVQNLTGHEYGVASIDVFPDGRLLSTSPDNTLKIWDLSDGSCVKTLTTGLSEHESCVLILPDGRVASGGGDGIRLWDMESFRPDPPCRGIRPGIRTGLTHFPSSNSPRWPLRHH